MPTFTDQMGYSIELDTPPKRIVSLVPSQTELLFDMGLEEKIVGITKFCIHPIEKCKKVAKVGGTKDFKWDRIAGLKPDLIIGNKEENEQQGIQALQKRFPVWMSDISTLTDAYNMMLQLGELTETEDKTIELVAEIQQAWSLLPKTKPFKVAYFIWQNPYMVAATGTFINHLIQQAGWINIFAHKSRYPTVTINEVKALKPDVLFLSSEPFPFKEKQVQEMRTFFPEVSVQLVDGEMFSWYGSRLLHAAIYIHTLQEKMKRY